MTYILRSYDKNYRLVLIGLALFSIDIALQGIVIFILLGLWYILAVAKTKPKCDWALSLFSTLFLLTFIWSPHFEGSIFKNVIALPIAFMFGASIRYLTPKKITAILLICAIFMSLHAFLNMAYNFKNFGMAAMGMRMSYDFWTGEISSSTGQAAKMTPLIACLFCLIFYNKTILLKITGCIIFILIVLYDLALGGRSALVLIVFGIIISLLLSIKKEHNFKRTSGLIVGLSILIILFTYAYLINAFDIQGIFEESSFNQRFNGAGGQDIREDDRMRRKYIYIANLLTYPFGGQHLCFDEGLGHAHDLWLDSFDMGGLFPFILVVLYSMLSVYRGYKYYKNPNVAPYYGVILFSFTILMNIQFFLEPIIEGSPKLFILYCFIDGMVYRYIRQYHISKRIIN